MAKLKKKNPNSSNKKEDPVIKAFEFFFGVGDSQEFMDQVVENFDENDNAQQDKPQTVEETNYTTNYYTNQVINNSTYNQRIVRNVYGFPVNYNNPKYRRKSLNRVNQPENILPTEIDNQTSTQTVSTSISVKQSSLDDASTYGRLKFNPLSTQKIQIKRKAPVKNIAIQFDIIKQRAIENFNKAQNGETTPIEDSGYLLTPSKLSKSGKGNILLGFSSINALSQAYRILSSQAFIEPTNEIATDFEEIEINDQIRDLKFEGEATRVSNNIAFKLGYSDEDFAKKTLEEIIIDYGLKQYELDSATANKNANAKTADELVTSNKIGENAPINIEQLVISVISSIFYRNGFHRFPATLPKSMVFDTDEYKNPSDQPKIFIDDHLEFQEYLLNGIDALFGQFPAEFNYEYIDSQGKKQKTKIKIPNLAEGLTELIAVALNTQNNSETSVALGLKNLVETVKALNVAISASDWAKANGEYLGYKFKETEKEVPLTFTPNAKNIKEALKDSTGKTLSVENVDGDALGDDLKKILIAAEVIKAAFVQPFNGKDGFLTGDGIKKRIEKDKEQYDQSWQDTLNKFNKKTGSNDPILKDKSTQ